MTNALNPLDHVRLADLLLPAVLAAGRVEMRYFEAGVAVETKPDSSPVTAADREAEALLLDALGAAVPGVPVIAEESIGAAPQLARGAPCFLVDPLDGTRGFVSRSNEFTINIGLILGGAPVFGLIYAPALAALYLTVGPGSAVETRLPPESGSVALSDCHLVPLRTRTPDPEALVALVSRSHRSEEATDAFLARCNVASVRYVSSSLKFCLIARGEADLYPRLGPTSEWDTAAGHAILSAAGGCVTTLDGAPLTYGNAAEGILNPHFVAWAREPQVPASGPRTER